MSNQEKETGTFVISLDFELMWGMFDVSTLDEYGDNVRAVHTVVPRTLQLFRGYNIKATWATVGMLLADDLSDLEQFLPATQPKFSHSTRSAYAYIAQHQSAIEQHPECFFAPALVQLIAESDGQELASHTFAHYYCREETVGGEGSEASFAADCAAQRNIFREKGYQTPTSLVFPRNQVTSEVLRVAVAAGITTYRGTEQSFLYKNGTLSPLPIRALRLLDSYINLTGHHTHPYTPVNRSISTITNTPSSHFLRPYSSRLQILESLKLKRIKNAMTHAAKRGEVFHLWWHPHNFGTNQVENFSLLTTILEHYQYLQQECGMESKAMKDLTPVNESLSSD